MPTTGANPDHARGEQAGGEHAQAGDEHPAGSEHPAAPEGVQAHAGDEHAASSEHARSGRSGGLVLVLNSGSSSVKFALLIPSTGERVMQGLGERLGTPEALLRFRWFPSEAVEEQLPDGTHKAVVARVLHHLGRAGHAGGGLLGAGHRVVHGGERFTGSMLVTEAVTDALRSFSHLAPLHNPANLAGIEAVTEILPDLPQVAVFDTAFHQTMPPYAFRYAVPEEWYTRHLVRRYGFHGTSHRFVSERTASMLGRSPRDLRVVTAHLGNGCSAAAVRDGVSVDTTMGLTPLEGLVMGTRSGDVDPGIFAYLAGTISPRPSTSTAGFRGSQASATTCARWRPPLLRATSAPRSPSTSSCTAWPNP